MLRLPETGAEVVVSGCPPDLVLMYGGHLRSDCYAPPASQRLLHLGACL